MVLVCVTGVTGFIASHVAQQLLVAGYSVRGTVRSLKDTAKSAYLLTLCPTAKHSRIELVEADLTDVHSWAAAVAGCEYVIHVASPFPPTSPSDKLTIITPAVNGTLNVLKACAAANPPPRRVVLTSSEAAISGGHPNRPGKPWTEADWTIPDDPAHPIGAYVESKTLAERAAWKFMADSRPSFSLVTICPGFVIGPPLSGAPATSMELIRRLLQREMPGVIDIGFDGVDVRDVALAHIRAMALPEAAGKRFLCAPYDLDMQGAARTLDAEFRPYGYRVPTLMLPNFLVRCIALFDHTLSLVTPALGKRSKCDCSAAESVLGMHWRDMRSSLIDMGYAAIRVGIVRDLSRDDTLKTKAEARAESSVKELLASLEGVLCAADEK